MGQIMKDSRCFFVPCCLVKPPSCILYGMYSIKCQFLSDSSDRVHPSLIDPLRRSARSWTQMKVKSRPSLSLNLHPSIKMIVSVTKNIYVCLFSTATSLDNVLLEFSKILEKQKISSKHLAVGI